MTDLPSTRHSLLLQLGQRDNSAWSDFLEVYEKAIVGYCIRRGLQEADAWDATQEVYAAIQQRMASWDPNRERGSFRAWLFRVARNVSVDILALRGQLLSGGSHFEKLMADVHDHRDVENGLRDASSTAFQLEWRRALFEWAAGQVQREVRDITWQAFCRTAIAGQRPDVVATDLGLSVGTVYTAKCRVMARMRDRIHQWQEGEWPDGENWSVGD